MTPDDFDQALSAARQALDDVTPNTAPATGTGVAADGLIRVSAEAGRLSDVVIDPRAMRLPPAEFADQIRAAVNSALAEADVTATPEAAALPDPVRLAQQLEELQNQSVRQMARYTQSISEVMAALKHRG